jgi:hypothetical protein
MVHLAIGIVPPAQLPVLTGSTIPVIHCETAHTIRLFPLANRLNIFAKQKARPN